MKPNALPGRFAAIVERVNKRDREYFRDHPGEAAYLRPYVPGEYPPGALAALGAEAPELGSWVLVTTFASGIRSRRPIGRIVAGRPSAGRMTVVSPEGMLAEDVPVVGWEGGR